MSAKAGYLESFYCKATNSYVAGDLVAGIKDFNLSFPAELEDVSNFKDGSGYKLKLQKLKDSAIDCSGQYESGDAVQQLIRASWLTGATVYCTVIVDSTASTNYKGWTIPMIVESYDTKGNVGGIAEFSAKFVGNGAPVAV